MDIVQARVRPALPRLGGRQIMIPHEHGAWAMLYVPFLLTLFVVGKFDFRFIAALLLLTSVFFAHEPLAQLARIKSWSHNATDRRRQAILWLGVYLFFAALASAPLIFLYRLWFLLPIGAFVMLFLSAHAWLISRKSDRTVHSELLGILCLTSSAPVLYYVLQHRFDNVSYLLWLLNVLYFISSIFYVKMVVARFTGKGSSRSTLYCALYHAALLAILLFLTHTGLVPALVLIAFLPIFIRAAFAMRPRNARLNLRKVGFAETGFTLFFLVVTVLAYRL